MKRFFEKVRSEKGISMVTLVITIVLIIILASIIIYNSRTNINVEKLDKMYADLQTLQDKVDLYYAKTGELPISSNPSDKIQSEDGKIFGIDQAESDGDIYSKINLSLISDDLKLNYSTDYYVNDESHIVYSADGVNIDGHSYHRLKDTYSRVDTSDDGVNAFTITFHYKKGDNSSGTAKVLFNADTVVKLASGATGSVDYSIDSTNVSNLGIDSSYNIGWYKNQDGSGDIEKSVVMNQNYDLYSVFTDKIKPIWPEDDPSSSLTNFIARHNNEDGILYDGTWTNDNIWVKATAIDNALVEKFVLSINNVFLKEIVATHDTNDSRIGYGINTFDSDMNTTVDYIAVDNSGNESDKKGIALKIDKQRPEVVTASASNNSGTGTLDDLRIYVKAKDTGDSAMASGFRYISITSSDSPDFSSIDWYDTSDTTEGTGEKEFTINNKKTGAGYWINDNGTYYVWVKDQAGNINTKNSNSTIVVDIIDTTPITVSFVPPENTTYSKSQTVTILLQDSSSGNQGTSGLKTGVNISYGWSLSKETEPTSWTQVPAAASIEVTEANNLTGKYYLWVKDVQDNAGNVIKTNSGLTITTGGEGQYYFDNTAPTLTVSPETVTTVAKSHSVNITIEDLSQVVYYYGWSSSNTIAPTVWKKSVNEKNNDLTSPDTAGFDGNYYLWVVGLKDTPGNETAGLSGKNRINIVTDESESVNNLLINKIAGPYRTDTKAPTVTFTPNGFSEYQQYRNTIKVTFSDDSGIASNQTAKYLWSASNSVASIASATWTNIQVKNDNTIDVPWREGANYIWVKGVNDTVGNELSPTHSEQYKIDNTAPTVTLSVQNGNVIKIHIVDELSRPDDYIVTNNSSFVPTVDSQEWEDCNEGDSTSVDIDYTAQENGTYYVWAKDHAGNIYNPHDDVGGSITINFKYIVEYYANNPSGTTVTGSTSPYTQEIRYGSGSNLIANKYVIQNYGFVEWKDESGNNSYSNEYTTNSAFDNIASSNNNFIKLYAQWEENINSITVSLYTNSNRSQAYNQNWTNSNVYGSITSTGERTIAKYQFRIGSDGTWTDLNNTYNYEKTDNNATFDISWSTNSTYYFRGVDSSNHPITSVSNGFNIKVDKGKPVVNNLSYTYGNGNTMNFTVRANDPANNGISSGIQYYRISPNGTWKSVNSAENANEITINASEDINSDGTYYFLVMDKAGNISDSTDNNKFTRDRTLPQITFDPDGGIYAMPTTGNAKIKSTITASDGSRISKIEYAWSSSGTIAPTNWTTYTSGNSVETEKTDCTINNTDQNIGEYYLWAKATDSAGNVGQARSEMFKILPNDGLITITLNPAPPTWTNTQVNANISYNSVLLNERTATANGTVNTDYKVVSAYKVEVYTNGKTVTASAKDSNGNLVTKSVTVNNIDKIAPTISKEEEDDNSDTIDGKLYRSNFTITVEVTDNQDGSGVNEIQYYVSDQDLQSADVFANGNGTTLANNGTIHVSNQTSGHRYVYIYASDNAGNISYDKEDYYVDDKGPIIKVNSVVAGSEMGNYSELVSLEVYDEETGVYASSIILYLNNSEKNRGTSWTNNSDVFSIDLGASYVDGSYSVSATDKVGNETTTEFTLSSLKEIPVPDQTTLSQIGDGQLRLIGNNRYNFGNSNQYTYYLTNDIALDNNWTPLEKDPLDNTKAFDLKANFNGYNYEISSNNTINKNFLLFNIISGKVENLKINGKLNATGTAGLIASELKQNGIIDNVNVNCDISGSGITIGGLVGENDGNILNCSVSGNIATNNTDIYIGGVAGTNKNHGNIEKTYSDVQLKTTGIDDSSDNCLGGVVGLNRNTILKSYFKGYINPSGSGATYVGGIVGDMEGGQIDESYNMGNINFECSDGCLYNIGGIVGLFNGEINNCFNTGNMNFTWSDNTAGYSIDEGNAGGIVGSFSGNSSINTVYSIGKISDAAGGFNVGTVYGNKYSFTVSVSNAIVYSGNPYSVNNATRLASVNDMATASTYSSFGSNIWEKSYIRLDGGYGYLPYLKFNEEEVKLKDNGISITISNPSSSVAKQGDVISYTITISESVANIDKLVCTPIVSNGTNVTATSKTQIDTEGKKFRYTMTAGSGNGTAKFSVSITGRDASATSKPFTIKNTKPTITLGSPSTWYKGGATVSLSLKTSESTTAAVLKNSLSLKFGSGSSLPGASIAVTGSGTEFTVNAVMPTATRRNCYLYVASGAITDSAGNTSDAISSNTWGVDNTSPTKIDDGIVDNYYKQYRFQDSESGIKEVYYAPGRYTSLQQIQNATGSVHLDTVVNNTITAKFVVETVSYYTFYIVDQVGNVKLVNDERIDSTLPTPTISFFKGSDNTTTTPYDEEWTNQNVYFKFSGVSGATKYEYKIYYNGSYLSGTVIDYSDEEGPPEEYDYQDEMGEYYTAWVPANSANTNYVLADYDIDTYEEDEKCYVYVKSYFGSNDEYSSTTYNEEHVRIDKTAPSVTFTNSDDEYITDILTTKINVSDEGSGLASGNEYKYAIKSISENITNSDFTKTFTSSVALDDQNFSVVGDDEYIVLWVKGGIRDLAGNETVILSEKYKVERYLDAEIDYSNMVVENTKVTLEFDFKAKHSQYNYDYNDDGIYLYSGDPNDNNATRLSVEKYPHIDTYTETGLPNDRGNEEIEYKDISSLSNNRPSISNDYFYTGNYSDIYRKDFIHVYKGSDDITNSSNIYIAYAPESVGEKVVDLNNNGYYDGSDYYDYYINDIWCNRYKIFVEVTPTAAQTSDIYIKVNEKFMTDDTRYTPEVTSERIEILQANYPAPVVTFSGGGIVEADDVQDAIDSSDGYYQVEYIINLPKDGTISGDTATVLQSNISIQGSASTAVSQTIVTKETINNKEEYVLKIRIKSADPGELYPVLAAGVVKNNYDNTKSNIKTKGNLTTIVGSDYTIDGLTIPKGFYLVGGTLESGYVISDNKLDQFAYVDGHGWKTSDTSNINSTQIKTAIDGNTGISNDKKKKIGTRTVNNQTQYLVSYVNVGDNFRDNYNGKTTSDTLVGNQFIWVPAKLPDNIVTTIKNYSYSGRNAQIIKSAKIWKRALSSEYYVKILNDYIIYDDGSDIDSYRYNNVIDSNKVTPYNNLLRMCNRFNANVYTEGLGLTSELRTSRRKLTEENNSSGDLRYKYYIDDVHSNTNAIFVNGIEKSRAKALYCYDGFFIARYDVRLGGSEGYIVRYNGEDTPTSQKIAKYDALDKAENVSVAIKGNKRDYDIINGAEYDSTYVLYSNGYLRNLKDFCERNEWTSEYDNIGYSVWIRDKYKRIKGYVRQVTDDPGEDQAAVRLVLWNTEVIERANEN